MTEPRGPGSPAPRGSGPRPVSGARWAGAVAVTVLLLVAGSLGWARLVPGSGPDASPAPPPAGFVGVAGDADPGWAGEELTPQQARDATRLLQTRAAAVVGRDRADWASTIAPGAFGSRQLALFERLMQLPLTRWSYHLLGPGPRLSPSRQEVLGPGARVLVVQESYRLAGESRDTVRRQSLTVRPAAGRSVAVGDTDGTSEPDLWDLGPIEVVATSRVLVIGAVPDAAALRSPSLRTVAADAGAAAARVDAVWGRGLTRTAVVLVPVDLPQLARLLGRSGPGGLDQLAAVTSGELGGSNGTQAARSVADRVLLNPVAFAGLSDLGRLVVLTHELTHLATRSIARRTPPIWLEEGVAEYVAYRGVGLSAQVIAADALASVRAGRTAPDLPGPDDFDPGRGNVSPAYGLAWLACDLIAAGDPARMVAFYRRATGASPDTVGLGADAALRTAFAAGPRESLVAFTAAWRTRLRALAAGRG